MTEEKKLTTSMQEIIINKYVGAVENVCEAVIEIALDKKVAAQVRLKAAQMILDYLHTGSATSVAEPDEDETLTGLTDEELGQIEAILQHSLVRQVKSR